MTEDEIVLNKVAQDNLDFDEAVWWFDGLDEGKQKEVLDKLILFIQQSHPTKESVDVGLSSAPIKQTMTPVLIFRTKDLNVALTKIRALPKHEWRKEVVVMLSIFRIADTKRRETDCKDGCTLSGTI